MEVSQHAKEHQRVLVIENQDNGAFVQAFQRALRVALGFEVCVHPVSEGESLHQILLALKDEGESADILYINAHLVYQECPDPYHCGGLELLKHIRLTPSLGRVSLLPVILAVLDSPERYIRLRTDNVIILSPVVLSVVSRFHCSNFGRCLIVFTHLTLTRKCKHPLGISLS